MKCNGGQLSSISDSVVEYILSCNIKDLENITVNSIAQKFNLNRCYLSQRFKFDKDFSLHEYIVMVKILRSLLLLETDETITVEDLSRKMGFSSADYFTRLFKKKIGTTPGKYRSCYKNRKSIKP